MSTRPSILDYQGFNKEAAQTIFNILTQLAVRLAQDLKTQQSHLLRAEVFDEFVTSFLKESGLSIENYRALLMELNFHYSGTMVTQKHLDYQPYASKWPNYFGVNTGGLTASGHLVAGYVLMKIAYTFELVLEGVEPITDMRQQRT